MLAPGIMTPTAWMLRPVGTVSSTSRVITVRCVTLCMSTMGDWPATVIVSSTAPDLHGAVDRGSEVGRQFDVVALHRIEAAEREGD